MWIVTNKGFASAVAHDKLKNVVVVRARNKEILSDFTEKLVETDDSDYRFRVFVSRGSFSRWLEKKVKEIDYTNFKSSIPAKDKDLKEMAGTIWGASYKMQTGRYGPQKPDTTFIPQSYYAGGSGAATAYGAGSGYYKGFGHGSRGFYDEDLEELKNARDADEYARMFDDIDEVEDGLDDDDLDGFQIVNT